MIWFDDLKPEVQQVFRRDLRDSGIDPDDMNLEDNPIAIVKYE